MLHRQAGGFDDGLDVQQCLPCLAFDCGGKFSLGVAPALTGYVEKVAGENPWTVRTNGFDAGRSNRSLLRSGTESTADPDDNATQKESDACHLKISLSRLTAVFSSPASFMKTVSSIP